MDVTSSLTDLLNDAGTGWSMGTFGALAEFHREADEPFLQDATDGLERATSRGAIRIEPTDELTPVAHETLSSNPQRWGHAIAFCLPDGAAVMAERHAVTELGVDDAAIREQDRGAILFDMGLSALGASCRQVDFCIRTSDPDLIATLRTAEGQSIFDPSCQAMGAILQAHPNRVALTRLGRVEVFQPIGGPATGGVSPAGPHTHVLPDLLGTGRTHSANVPIPDGLVPCAWAYPASPVSTALGKDKPYDAALHDAFTQILEQWGVPSLVETKKRVRDAVAAEQSPSDFAEPASRYERAAMRVALRQLSRRAQTPSEQSQIETWRSVFDKSAVADDPIQAQHQDVT